MKIEINVPTTLNDITLGQYQKFLKIAENNEDSSFLDAKMIEIFCGIPLSDSYKLKMSSVTAILDILYELLNTQPKHQTRFTMNGVDYGFIPDLDDMSLGEYIDLDNHIGNLEKIHYAMNVLYRPIVTDKAGRYNIVEYEVGNEDKMKDMPLGVVLGSIVFFYHLGKELSMHTLTSLDKQNSGDLSSASNFSRKWGWYQSIYGLANGDITRFEDITKLNVNQCFTMLSFMKEKAQLEAQTNKK
jgi:hypothetical protein